jgi:hypothetical protein
MALEVPGKETQIGIAEILGDLLDGSIRLGQQAASRGPLMTKATNEGGKIMVAFEHTGEVLKTSDGQPEIPGFEMAASNGKFNPATARIGGTSTVEITCAEVSAPAVIRYAWRPWTEPPLTLQNSDGLPAEPSEIRLP